LGVLLVFFKGLTIFRILRVLTVLSVFRV
jgi:hypothetical protein